jgi:hypothetical protein
VTLDGRVQTVRSAVARRTATATAFATRSLGSVGATRGGAGGPARQGDAREIAPTMVCAWTGSASATRGGAASTATASFVSMSARGTVFAARPTRGATAHRGLPARTALPRSALQTALGTGAASTGLASATLDGLDLTAQATHAQTGARGVGLARRTACAFARRATLGRRATSSPRARCLIAPGTGRA